jgi:1-deoxy-D-xylulose 5-phosphate reductoisomerase (EC 1.1.1.267)
MHLPILYGLSWPERLSTPWEPLDLVKLGSLTFRAPDHRKYPCLQLAYAAGRAGGTLPAVLNAANEAAVNLFLQERIRFLDIPRLLEQVCERHQVIANPTLEDILEVDAWARQQVELLAQQAPAQVLA